MARSIRCRATQLSVAALHAKHLVNTRIKIWCLHHACQPGCSVLTERRVCEHCLVGASRARAVGSLEAALYCQEHETISWCSTDLTKKVSYVYKELISFCALGRRNPAIVSLIVCLAWALALFSLQAAGNLANRFFVSWTAA